MQADTLVPEPGNPQSLNRFAYVYNNPARYTDPSGHWIETALDIAGIAYDLYEINRDGLNWVNGLALAADVACLIAPVAAGGGMAVRAIAHADDVADVARVAGHADDVVDIIQGANRVDDAVDTARTLDLADDASDIARGVNDFGELTHAAEYGIDSAKTVRSATKGTGLQAHHIVEQRFADTLGLDPNEMLSVAVTPAEHQKLTNAWRQQIAYVNQNARLNTLTATRNDIWRAAQRVYKNYPALLQSARRQLFGGR